VQVVLLVGPTVLAFRAGGFFDSPRAVAAVAVWALVGLSALTFTHPLPRDAPSRVALGALAGLCVWVGVGSSWAPLDGSAQDDLIRDLLYLGALLIAITAWRHRRELRRVEPALAAGTMIVVGYGLAGRLVPDLVEQRTSISAAGRLDQPLTYWNAMGALAAIGFVLCARLAGDHTRPAALRAAGAAAAVPLATGVYVSFSRGALAALAAGLVALVLLAPTRAQFTAVGIVIGGGVLAALVASFLPAVEALEGSDSDRRVEGLVMLVALLAIAAVAALGAWRLAARGSGSAAPGRLPGVVRRRGLVAAAALLLIVGGPLAAAAFDDSGENAREDASAERFRDVGSSRYDYWRVALGQFADDPFRGDGSGSFEVEWRREREIDEAVGDAHSLPLETAAELGLVGLALLAALLGAAALGAARAWRADASLAAGLAAALSVWAVHACLDWDWEMPALTLVAVVLAGALLAAGAPAEDLSEQRVD
jgi:O-Antigen ligase